MGKNLSKGVFSIDEWTINPCGEIALAEPEECGAVFHGRFQKKRGRPKMEEKFFYDPYEIGGDILVGIDTASVKIGDAVIVGVNRRGHVTKLIGSNTVKVNWKITYGK